MTESSTTESSWQEEDIGKVAHIKGWSNPGGSIFNKKIPALRLDVTFPEKTTIDELINAMYNYEVRKQWDTKTNDVFKITSDHPNMNIGNLF